MSQMFAATVAMAAFTATVVNVIGLRAKPEVRRVHAVGTVPFRAIVQNFFPFGDWTKVQNPTGVMRCYEARFPSGFANLAVAVVVVVKPDPEPARFRNPHLGEKAGGEILGQSLSFEKLFGYVCSLHNKLVLLCGRALGGSSLARVFPFCHWRTD
jgi:hypothetical protein